MAKGPYWPLEAVVLWIATRSEEAAQGATDPLDAMSPPCTASVQPQEPTPEGMEHTVKLLARYGVGAGSLGSLLKDIAERCQAEELACSGRLSVPGQPTSTHLAVPSLDWRAPPALRQRGRPSLLASIQDRWVVQRPDNGSWGDLLFRRDAVLALWPPLAATTDPTKLKARGRPSTMGPVLAEHRRRLKDGCAVSSVSKEAAALAVWAEARLGKTVKQQTIENSIRKAHRAHYGPKPRKQNATKSGQ